MKDEVTKIPKHLIINAKWNHSQLYTLFSTLKKDSVFGYSAAFEYDNIVGIAGTYGVKVRLLPLRHPLRKKYGNYVLKVTASMKEMPQVRDVTPIRVGFEDIHYYAQSIAKGNRVCQGHLCGAPISKGSKCLEIVELKDLFPGRKIYNKKSYCINCAASILSYKISALTKLGKSLTL
jgi:hypothetical protein